MALYLSHGLISVLAEKTFCLIEGKSSFFTWGSAKDSKSPSSCKCHPDNRDGKKSSLQ